MPRLFVWAALAAFVLGAGPLAATSFHMVADQTLADQADVVLHGRVMGQTVTTRQGRVVTVYKVLPVDVIKGWASPHGIAVEVLGGELPNGRFLHIFGAPSFELDQEVLLFLRRTSAAPMRILHVMQGAFVSIENGGDYAWFRAIDDVGAAPIAKTSANGEGQEGGVRNVERFVDWLHDRVAGIHRVSDYRDDLGADGAAVVAKFTLLGGNDNPPHLRWFLFNEGGRVQWLRHQSGQPGSADGGAGAFAQARQAWNGEPNTPVRYRNGGTTASRNGFGALDGLTTILFRDLNDDIDTDYSCVTGGTLAIGGVHGVRSFTPRTWKALPFLEATEAEIVVNTGLACFAGNNRDLAELYTHELGHTLGLGHSCGDDNSPSCAGNGVLGTAVMRATFPLRSTGAVLRSDDIAGIRFLYEANGGGGGGGGPTCNSDLGSGRFCTDCGPCSDGQGDCDSNAECLPGLVCRDNVGAMFGFAAGIDVCVDPNGGGGGGGGGGGTTCNLNNGHPQLCSDPQCGPCGFGEGDCDNDAECAAGLVCEDNVGALFGFAPGIDVCTGTAACTETLGTGRYCTACGPCGAGQGDCDNDAECAAGLTCVDNVGANFGFAAGVDVCM